MTRWIALAVLVAGCSSLPGEGDGVVALELRSPLAITLRAGESYLLQARALNIAGDSVPAVIRWRTSDTTISVDSLSGQVTALQGTGTGSVQAAVGSLRSNLIVFTLQPVPTGGVRLD